MDNNFVFSDAVGYDMVVAITEKTINDQIKTLASSDVGIIKTEIVVQMGADPKQHNKYVPMVMNSWDRVPKDVNGIPVNVCMRADYLPSVSITNSGTNAALVLNFTGGEFYMRDFGSGNINPAIDMTGWIFGIIINLDFAGIERGLKAPKFVIDQLNHFTSDMFRVSQLFLNFERSDLTRFDPSVTSVGQEDDSVKVSFVYLMSSWLKYFKDNAAENPFILGYTISRTDKSNVADMGVPDSLKPIGNTFNVYKDPLPGKSTVNFILNTFRQPHTDKAGQHDTPGNFSTNWIDPSEKCQAKLIYSCGAFLEDLILKPFYTKYTSTFHEKIKEQIDIKDAKSYLVARVIDIKRPRFISYAVHDEDQGDDQYHNGFNVAWTPLPGTNGVSLTWNGSWRFRKYRSVNLGLTHANAWGQASGSWNTTMNIEVALNDQGRPILKASEAHVHVQPIQTDHWENDAAKATSILGDIFGGFLDLFTKLFGGPDFTNMLQNVLGGKSPDVQAVDISNIQLGKSISAAFLLPAGDVFDFKNFSMLDTGESCLELTYKTETGGSTVVPTTTAKVAMHNVSSPPRILRNSLRASQPPTPNNLAAPLIDNIQLQPLKSIGPTDSTRIDLSVSCELMKNTSLGLPISLASDLSIVQDDKGNAHLLSVGSDGKLNLLVAASGETSSGWSVNNLMATYTEHSKCLAFDVYQNQHGQVSLGFALKRISGTASDVFYAVNLPSQNLTKALLEIQAYAKPVTAIDITFVPEQIRFGSTDDGKPPMLSIEGSLGFNHMWYQIASGSTAALAMEFPQNVDQGGSNIVAQRSGFAFGSRANYFLYNVSSQRQLMASAVDNDGNAGNTYDYSPTSTELPAKYRNLTYNTIEVATSRTDAKSPASDLYIGTSTGLYRIPNGKHAAMEAVTNEVKDIHMVTVVVDGTSVSIWVLSAGNALSYIHGQRQPGPVTSTAVTWNNPVLFASNIISIAAIRSVFNKGNEVYLLTQDSSIEHYWQDPNSTLWQSRTASVPHSRYVFDFDSFTTHIHLEVGGVPFSNQALRITCSEWQYYTINGLLYSLDEDVPAQVTTDDLGNLTLIATASGIATHVLHIQGDSFAETINVYPSGKIQYHLQHITDGESLRSARQQDGKPVVDPATSKEVSDGVAGQVSTLHSVASDQFPPSQAGNIFTVAVHPSNPRDSSSPNSKQTLLHNIAVPSLPKGHVIGAAIVNGEMQPMQSQAVQKLLHATQSLKISFNPIDIAGDVLHHIESIGGTILSGIKDGLVQLDNGIQFVISHLDDGLTFVLHLANGIVKIALKSLAMVFKALNYILKLVGIDITKLLRWLGHLIGWDEVWNTHKVIAGFMKSGVDYAAKHGVQLLDSAKWTIDHVFDNLDDAAKRALLPIETGKSSLLETKVASQNQSNVPLNTPQMNFANYHATQGEQTPDTSVSDETSGLQLSSLYDDFLQPLATTFMSKMGRDMEDVFHLLTHGSMEDIKKVMFDVIDTVIAMFKQFTDSLLELSKKALVSLRDFLESDLDLPFIGAIYEFVTALFGEEESFSIINGMAFLIAIPLTVIMKCSGLGSFADSVGANMLSAADAVVDVAKWAANGLTKQKVSITTRAVQDVHIKPMRFLQASATDDGTVKREATASAAAIALVAQCAVAANTSFTFLKTVGVLQPKSWKNSHTGSLFVQQVFSIPYWVHILGKNDTVVGLRWTRWILGVVAALVTTFNTKDSDKHQAALSTVFSAVGFVFTIVIDSEDKPASNVYDKTLASDVCQSLGNLVRCLGRYTELRSDNKNEKVLGRGMMVLGASSAVAGTGVGISLAASGWKAKSDPQDFGNGFPGFVGAVLNMPLG